MHKIQFTVISIFYIIILITQLLISKNTDDITTFIFFINNLILIFHLWWGSFYFLNYLEPIRGNKDYFLFIPVSSLLFVNLFFIKNPHIWFFTYGLIFSFVIINYSISKKRIKNPRLVRYIENKIKLESPAVILFFIGSLISYSYSNLNLFLGVVVAIIQIGFIYFLIRKRVYRLNP